MHPRRYSILSAYRSGAVEIRRKPTLFASWGALVVLFIVYGIISKGLFSSYGISTFVTSGTALALAAAGEAAVVMAGGFDLSVGPILSVVNVLIATRMHDSAISEWSIILLALVVGALAGALNGVLVALAKLPSVIVTLATSFLWSGVAVLILASPGGTVPADFASRFTGIVAGFIPDALILLLIVVALWLAIGRTRLRVHILALGGDRDAARANSVPQIRTEVLAFALAGLLYGLSGVFLSAQTASGNPTLGDALTLSAFTAVVVGGTQFGGGRGSPISGIVGASILTVIQDILFFFGVSNFYTYIFTGAILVVAVVIQNPRSLLFRRERLAVPVGNA